MLKELWEKARLKPDTFSYMMLNLRWVAEKYKHLPADASPGSEETKEVEQIISEGFLNGLNMGPSKNEIDTLMEQ